MVKVMALTLTLLLSPAAYAGEMAQTEDGPLYIEITKLDNGPKVLENILPIKLLLYKRLHNEDGADYVLAFLEKPTLFAWHSRIIRLLIVGARSEGQRIGRGAKNLPINIAAVTNESIIDDDILDFEKGEFIAIGECSEVKND